MNKIALKSLLIFAWLVIVSFFIVGGIAAINPNLLLNNDTIMSFIYSYSSILLLASIVIIFADHKINKEKYTVQKTILSMLIASGLIIAFTYIAHLIGAPLVTGVIAAMLIFSFGNFKNSKQ